MNLIRRSSCLLFLVYSTAAAGAPPTGFQAEVKVEGSTRLDWEFAAADFGRDAVKLPGAYDSRKQRYQLYVPNHYDANKAWPLVVFISPGDDPLGWRYWQKPCEQAGMLFCAPYGAGNNCPAGQRARIVLDMLDDVRRHYRIDPDQTYLSGFSGGGRMACTIGFALPEYFGGVIPFCGTNPLNRLDYVRHRIHDRLSVAFVTGASDFNRKENEEYMHPMFEDMGIRSRLWVVPKLGHAVPGPDVLNEVIAWLNADLPRRRAEAKGRPGLAALDDVPTPMRQAARALESAEAELKQPERTWRAVALLQGIAKRWTGTDAAARAGKLLEEIQADPKRAALLVEQGGKDERRTLSAQAKALDRFGDTRRALQAWEALARQHPDTAEGKRAAVELQRLRAALASTPYLGVAFSGNNLTIGQVVAGGPAARAGLKEGDRLVKVGETKVATLQDLRKALQAYKPGSKIVMEVERGGKMVTMTVELGALPAEP